MFNEVVLCLCTQIVACRRTGQRQQHLYEHYEHTQTKQTGVQMHNNKNKYFNINLRY